MAARILIVEDDASVSLTLSAVLEREGYEVEVWDTVSAARLALEKTRFEAAIVDLVIGQENGITLVTWLQQYSPRTAVVVLTGYGSLETAVQSLRAGAADYLLKPCDIGELKAAIERAIQQKRRSEDEALRQGERRYLALLDTSPVAIAIHRGGTLVYLNAAAMRLLGPVTRDDFVGRDIREFIHPDFQPVVAERIRRVQEGGLAEPLEEVFVRTDGTLVDVEAISLPITFDGKPAAEVVLQDISARKRAEEALQQQQQALELLIQASGALVSSPRTEAVLTEVLALAQRLVAADGYAVWRVDAATREWRILAAAGLSSWYQRTVLQTIQRGGTMPERPLVVEDVEQEPMLAGHLDLHRAEGTRALLVVPLRIRQEISGTIAFYYHTTHHFTEAEVRLAAALANLAAAALTSAELYEDQARLRAEAEAAEQEAQHAVQAREDFLSAAAHDLRTPLTSALLKVQVLERRMRRAGEPVLNMQPVADIRADLERFSHLLSELLDVARSERGRLTGAREPVDLRELALEVAGQAREGCTVVLEADSPVIGAYDRVRIREVLVNLVDNAAKYGGGQETPVRIVVKQHDGEARIAVIDRGIGIEPEDIPRLFDRFARGSNAEEKTSGMGLGLYICRTIVEEHGGTIWVESAGKGKGSTFHVVLPLQASSP